MFSSALKHCLSCGIFWPWAVLVTLLWSILILLSLHVERKWLLLSFNHRYFFCLWSFYVFSIFTILKTASFDNLVPQLTIPQLRNRKTWSSTNWPLKQFSLLKTRDWLAVINVTKDIHKMLLILIHSILKDFFSFADFHICMIHRSRKFHILSITF